MPRRLLLLLAVLATASFGSAGVVAAKDGKPLPPGQGGALPPGQAKDKSDKPEEETAPGATAPAPAPVLGKAVTLSGVQGTVTVRRPGSTATTTLSSAAAVPVGALIDAREGSLTLTSAGAKGATQRARFSGGRFRVKQLASSGGVTDLVLAGRPTCTARASAGETRRRRPPRPWGDGKGRFRTHGRNAVATVRGTKWLVEETCSGTLVRVTRGVVSVRDKRTGKTKTVRAGGRYLAKRATR
jgi:hypothetical protein